GGTLVISKSNGCRFDKSSEFGSRPSASEIPLKYAAYFPPGDCHGSSLISLMFTLRTMFGLGSARALACGRLLPRNRELFCSPVFLKGDRVRLGRRTQHARGVRPPTVSSPS